jgi:archaellum biogenesis protein FlaJ (TadC family)
MNFDYTKLFEIGYLFDLSPKGFAYTNEALLFAVILLLTSLLLLWLFKKRRNFVKLEKEPRLALRKHSKISLILSVLLLVFVIIRTQEITFLSARIIPFLLSIAIFINTIIAIIKSRRTKVDEKSVNEKDYDYMKYIPKKKKKG